MRMTHFTRAVLWAQLALRRTNTDVLVAGVLITSAAALWFGLLPGLTARIADEARAVKRARLAPPPAPVLSPQALAAERLAAFYAALGDAGHTEQVVMRLFDAASDTGVTLDKTEYKPARDAAGRFETYTIVLPVKGDYARLRRFCEKVLLTVPYAALEDMRFKRNSANDQMVEASLRFTVFLRPASAGTTLAAASEARR
ncbi:hypothetical protein LMG29542_06178 [Paraburkholderia humisilvae]|uniref:Uncharacterized protein n=1 Tax=Paraburkholderia humisilvae TaxID=627669 RepID=A0A6J5ETY7_9BURK|nr:hypothetical protein LMG29542_06178 [Paraburkholderia humisilvae]